MSVEALAAVFKHSEATLGARLVLIGIANRADEHGIGWPDVPDLMVSSRMGRSGVKGALAKLREAGEIEPVDDEENVGGRGRSTLYRICLPGLDGEYTDEARGRREGWVAWRQAGGKSALKPDRRERVQIPTPFRKGPDGDGKGSSSDPGKGPPHDGKGPLPAAPLIEEPSVEPSEEPSRERKAADAAALKFCQFLSSTFDEPVKTSYPATQLKGATWLLANVERRELKEAVEWASTRDFWATRARTAGKLKQAWPELRVAFRATKKGRSAGNRRSNREDLAQAAEEARKRAGR